MARITDAEVSAVNDRIAQAKTTDEAFEIIDGLTRTMLSRVLDLNHITDGRGVAARNALGAAHGRDRHARDNGQPAAPDSLHDNAGRKYVTYNASITKSDGSDTNAYGEPCEPGKGYRELAPKRGFYPQRNYSRDSGESPAAWLARVLRDSLGAIEGYNGCPTFYASDTVSDGPGRTASVAARAVGFTDDEEIEAARLLGFLP
ncbi:hypothetical protein I0C86_41265 [Plantactinospora sp. S1510]|uniref:Uncharacterized protein n=1 Tax=Plantactinospora alkalitolerans TaxID=2789879 RepID=A0ABS0H9Y4_9ACTN|nr:hypothetical protein [Plantactinospora alkalitolerans]MBF9135283.1 hypothetical protein [Plantactinospora alkalitolerans]